ncbi:hypothetical protein IFM89_009613 [Coptis chinensis]|uniref:Uncharacterized protein n=1 Tax=Coptis chinensis TaxID=261450 RepID=A0A835IV08_9MAGN|nr:hypothetical protein IFM89_009613 [Coptis chinensis]
MVSCADFWIWFTGIYLIFQERLEEPFHESDDSSRVITDIDGDGSNSEDSDICSIDCRERKIIVANRLPLHAQRDAVTGKWCFTLDEDSILLQMKDGFSSETEDGGYRCW